MTEGIYHVHDDLHTYVRINTCMHVQVHVAYVVNAGKRIHVYEKETNASFQGMTNRLRTHL